MSTVRQVEERSPIHAVHPIIPYCAGCDYSWEADPNRRLGVRFICPVDPQHVAALVKGEPGKFWLRIEARILQYELLSLGFFRGSLARHKTTLIILLRMLVVAIALTISEYGTAW